MSAEEQANITRELRHKTGCGIMDCIKALRQFDFDYDKATISER